MTRTFTVLVVLALAFLAAAPFPALAQQDEERVSRVVPIAAGGTLRLKNFSGAVTITGSDRTDVAIDAIRRAPRERLARIALDIEASGGDVVIEANRRTDSSRESDNNNVVETTFDIQVPRDIALDIDVFSSPVTVRGVLGKAGLKSFSGDLVLHEAAAGLAAKTFSGAVRVDWAPTVVMPEATAETFSGDIELQLPPAATGSLDFSTFSGDVKADVPVTVTSQQRRGLKATLGAGGSNQLRLKTFSGDVTIR